MRRLVGWHKHRTPWAVRDATLLLPDQGVQVRRTLWPVQFQHGLPGETWQGQVTDSASGSATAPPPYSQGVLDLHPVAYWPLDGNGNDATGNGYDLTTTGSPTWESSGPTSYVDWSVYLNGSTYFTAPSSLDPSGWTGITVLAWVMFPSSPSDNPRVVCNAHTDTNHNGFQLMFNSGLGSGFFDIGNGSNVAANWSTSHATGTWYFYCGAWSSTSGVVAAYFNGQTAATGSGTGTIQSSSYPVTIGRNPVYNGDYVTGYVSGVAIYDYALTQQQIQQLYYGALYD